jgi:hypothetical protein
MIDRSMARQFGLADAFGAHRNGNFGLGGDQRCQPH